MILLCPHELDVALRGITVQNAALSFSLVGHPWHRPSNYLQMSVIRLLSFALAHYCFINCIL